MSDNFELLILLQTKQMLVEDLKKLVSGSIEIRDKKYLYIHGREDGIPFTKYIGEYSEDLYNSLLSNNFAAKEYKKEIKIIDKRLKELNYSETKLSKEVKDNIDFAKRNLVESIYNQAILEGVSTTYVDTESIIDGGKVNNMTSDDILKIINLKHSWEFILNENVISTKTDYNLLCSINKLVIEGFYYSAGRIRNIPVNITGTNYKPSIPVESIIKEELERILSSKENVIDKSIELLLYIMKKQIFIDGNKRSAVLFINHLLISKGKGIIVIPASKVDHFRKLLIDYYENRNIERIKLFLKEECYKSMV
ncbi:MAG: Fic family protein [Bacilli bacterium]|nr:Fic family protein [Bacilli bacterium]